MTLRTRILAEAFGGIDAVDPTEYARNQERLEKEENNRYVEIFDELESEGWRPELQELLDDLDVEEDFINQENAVDVIWNLLKPNVQQKLIKQEARWRAEKNG